MTNVIQLDKISIGEVMTPRTDVVGIPITATVEQVQETMLDAGHLRLPVYEENLDTIHGVVIGRDVWKAARDGETRLAPLIRPLPFAPSTKRVEDLIPEMRSQLTKMAIVIDEFGGTAGLVTLEDLIEEIIGEIQDEHEDDDLKFQPNKRAGPHLGRHVARSMQRIEVEPTEDEEEGYDTIDCVLGRLNRILS